MVFIPFVSTFEKRKGGGGGKSSGGGGRGGSKGGSRGGSSSSGSKSGGSSSSSGGKSSGSGSKGTPSFKPSIAGSTRSTSMYGNGGGKAITIPANQPFAGRQAGGATRSQVYGTPYYGSGYPFYATGGYHGVAGRGFPFFFWPIVWGTTAGLGAAYLWASIAEYGPPGSGNRPGGVEVMLMIQDPTKNQTYHLIADSETANAMITPLTSSCPQIGNKPLAVAPFDGSNGQPKPEQTIQYYRASSVALTLQGYNNTAVFTENENGTKPADPLPPNIDTGFLTCINTTIGDAVPLVDASVALQTHAFWMLCVAMLVGLRNSL